MLSQNHTLGTASNDGPNGLPKVSHVFLVTWSHSAAHASFSWDHHSLGPTHWDYRRVLRLQAQASTLKVSDHGRDAESRFTD